MKRLILSALLVLPGALLLSGCGGGSGQTARSSHKTTRVTLKISLSQSALSKLAASRAAHAAIPANSAARGLNGRLIPSNSASLVVYYTGLNASGALITKSLDAVAVTPSASGVAQPSLTATIPDLAAGVDNIVAVALYDGPPTGTAPILPSGSPIATGSSTVNISVGSTATDNAIAITLQSILTGGVQFAFDTTGNIAASATLNDSAQHTLFVNGINNAAQPAPIGVTGTSSTLVTSVAGSTTGANLHWSVDRPDLVQLSATTGGSIQVQRRKAGAAVVTATYIESVKAPSGQTTNQTIQAGTFAITNSAFTITSQGTGILHDSASNSTLLGAGQGYDVTDEGYVAQADSNTGTRILQYSIANSFVGTDINITITPTDSTARVSYFQYPPPPGTPLPYFGFSYITFIGASGTNGVAKWTSSSSPFVILDQEARGQNLYLLESNSGVYQIEVRSQNDGSVTRTLPLSLGFTPARIAAIELSGETDLYVASTGSASTQIAQIKVGTTTTTTNANFATVANIVDIASSYDYNNFVTDTRFLYVLTTTDIMVLPTDGTTRVATTTLASGTVTPIALSTAYNSMTGVTNIYALGDTATNARIEGLRLP